MRLLDCMAFKMMGSWWRRWSPWALRRDLATERSCILSYVGEIKSLALETDRLRELMMVIRSSVMSHQGRKGYGVTAFIPDESVVKLRPHPHLQADFVEHVATHLVRRALLGLIHVPAGERFFSPPPQIPYQSGRSFPV